MLTSTNERHEKETATNRDDFNPSKTTMTTKENLQAIAENLKTQDNRCTAHPAFCVQVKERIGPIMSEYSDGEGSMFHDHHQCETYYSDGPDPDEWKRLKALEEVCELPDHITAAAYVERWKTVQTCFTEEGCKRYLAQDGHNLRHYHGTRIYVESFHRNLEMLEIREALMSPQPEFETA